MVEVGSAGIRVIDPRDFAHAWLLTLGTVSDRVKEVCAWSVLRFGTWFTMRPHTVLHSAGKQWARPGLDCYPAACAAGLRRAQLCGACEVVPAGSADPGAEGVTVIPLHRPARR